MRRGRQSTFFRCFHYGGCTSSGLSSFLLSRTSKSSLLAPLPEPCARRPWQLTGGEGRHPWQVPRLIFGLDNHGTSATDRSSMLHAAVTVKGVNAVVFNGEEVLGRGAASEHPPRNFELHWEAYALQRLFSKTGGGIKREEFMLGASLNVLACSGHMGPPPLPALRPNRLSPWITDSIS